MVLVDVGVGDGTVTVWLHDTTEADTCWLAEEEARAKEGVLEKIGVVANMVKRLARPTEEVLGAILLCFLGVEIIVRTCLGTLLCFSELAIDVACWQRKILPKTNEMVLVQVSVSIGMLMLFLK